jgi:hypothetical protein
MDDLNCPLVPECFACCRGGLHTAEEWLTFHPEYWFRQSDEDRKFLRGLGEDYAN